MVGGTVNDIGDWMLSLALPVYVFTETGSGRDTALVFLIDLFIGVVFGPFGGALADRWDLRRTIIGTNVLQALTLLPLLAVTHDRVWLVFIVSAAQAPTTSSAPEISTFSATENCTPCVCCPSRSVVS